MPLDADNSISPNRFPSQGQNTLQLQSPNGWKELKSRYPNYASNYADGPQPASTILTDLNDTDVIESHNSFENIGNLPKIQDQHGEDMALYPARKKYRGNEKFLFCKFNV